MPSPTRTFTPGTSRSTLFWLARFYPQARYRELARVIEIVSLIIRNVAPQIADEAREAKRALFIREMSAAVIAYITSALGAPNQAAKPVKTKQQSMPNRSKARRKTVTKLPGSAETRSHANSQLNLAGSGDVTYREFVRSRSERYSVTVVVDSRRRRNVIL